MAVTKGLLLCFYNSFLVFCRLEFGFGSLLNLAGVNSLSMLLRIKRGYEEESNCFAYTKTIFFESICAISLSSAFSVLRFILIS